MNAYDLTFCLQKFVFEVRKQNGNKYPAKTLYDIFSMLNYYVQNYLGHSYSLFKSRDEFLLSRKCLETAMKETSASGVTSGENKSKAFFFAG